MYIALILIFGVQNPLCSNPVLDFHIGQQPVEANRAHPVIFGNLRGQNQRRRLQYMVNIPCLGLQLLDQPFLVLNLIAEGKILFFQQLHRLMGQLQRPRHHRFRAVPCLFQFQKILPVAHSL